MIKLDKIKIKENYSIIKQMPSIQSPPKLNLINDNSYLNFVVMGSRKRPDRSRVEHLPHEQSPPRTSGFDSQSGRPQFLGGIA